MVKKILYSILTWTVFALFVISCQDEQIVSGTDEIPEGHTTINAEISFKPLSEGLKSRTDGEAIKAIKDLCILVYDANGKLFQTSNLTEGTTEYVHYTLSNVDRTDADAENGASAESYTPQAKFKMRIPYGKYYMYAVANMGNLATTHADEIQTIDGLKNISLTWDAATIANNNQMFGYFTESTTPSADEGMIVIDKKNISLHAWIKRAASKVTIAFDGRSLNENVFIYLKSVEIKDIPIHCHLGADNQPGKGITSPTQEQLDDELLSTGETMVYSSSDTYSSWPLVTKGLPFYYYGATDSERRNLTPEAFKETAHSETQNALYFFENVQGIGKDKAQDANGDKKLDYPGHPDYPKEGDNYLKKDDKLYGTYIEVKAYYQNTNGSTVSSGNIIYRFMLGMDTQCDYNAKRNYHYKLTLKFNGDANDVDWHIEYAETPGIYLPDPYYISYLYNQSMTLPVKVVGMVEGTNLRAQILENNWKPFGASSGEYYEGEVLTVGKDTVGGFLSLRKMSTEHRVQVTTSLSGDDGKLYGNNDYWVKHKQGHRTYVATTGSHPEEDGTYSVSKEANETYFDIPFYTRAKQLIPTTGYTANNPYVSYPRVAKVKFIAQVRNENGKEETMEKIISIYQVRRVINPGGVWRSSKGLDKPFKVKLMTQETEEATNFGVVQSNGPWTAIVEKGSSWIRINNGKTTITGETGSLVEFELDPFDAIGENEVRCGYIRISYHNNTCHHLVMVRQGYAPLALSNSSVKWTSYNVLHGGTHVPLASSTVGFEYYTGMAVSSPLDEGSMFKFGNWDHPIDVSNNDIYPYATPPGDGTFIMADGSTSLSWSDIRGNDIQWEANNLGYVPTQAEWTELQTQNDQIYGVLYGDDTYETKATITDAYGWRRDHTDRGMRGVFVYDSNGNNIFFPIGATGYGHRKHTENFYGYGINNPGTLRYAQRPTWMPVNGGSNGRVELSPLFWDIYEKPGAVYWSLDYGLNVEDNPYQKTRLFSWDINFYTYDFSSYARNAYTGSPGRSDACFVRMIVKPTP